MTALEYLLDGLEAELALERELGVRVVECDRSLLAVNGEWGTGNGERGMGNGERENPRLPNPNTQAPTNPPTQTPKHPPIHQSANPNTFQFLFLHDKPLSQDGAEMVAKITAALNTTPEAAPLVVAPPLPNARVYVVLGGLALKKWFPGKNAAPGQWLRTDGGSWVLVTYSPEYILRFKTVTPTMKKMKFDMWNSLKEIARRLRS